MSTKVMYGYKNALSNALIPYGAMYAGTMLPPRPLNAQSRNQYGDNNSLVMSKRVTKRRKRKSFKAKMYASKPAKHVTGEEGVTMAHNTLYTLTPTAIPVQGDADNSRDGDSIVLCGLKLRGYYNTDTAANGYSFRVIVGYTGEEYANTVFGSGLGTSELFLPNTGGTSTVGMINPKAFTVLHDEKFTCNSQITGVRDKLDYNIFVPLGDKLFYYQAGGSRLGKIRNLVVVICGDVIGGVSGVTAIGGTTITYDFVYKNA